MLLMNFYSLFCQVSFLTHYIFLKSRDVCFSVLNLVLPLFLMNAIHYYDLWVWYSNLCPSPRFLRKFVWLHQIFVAACGVWFPALGWNPGCLQSLFLFLLLSLEPDTQLLCACLCLHTSQESRPRLSRFNIQFDCSSTSSVFFFLIFQSYFSFTLLWSVEGSKIEEPVRHPRVLLIQHTKPNSTSCELYTFFSISPLCSIPICLKSVFLYLNPEVSRVFWFSSLS